MKHVEGWLVRHSPTLIGLVAIAVVVLGAATVWVTLRTEDVRDKVSPCVVNVNSAKCQKYRHRLAKSGSNRVPCITFHRATGRTGRRCSAPEPNGGGNQTSAPPEQQPSPPQGGQGGNGNGGNGTSPPPNPPSNPPTTPEPGLLDPVTDQVPAVECHLNVLDIQICN